MTLDDTRIRELLRFDDEDGVLSFYVGHTPEQAADPQPTAPIEIRNQLKALRSSLADRDGLADKVDARLEQARNDIDRLTDPHTSGRGRALFIGVTSGRTEEVRLQIPFRDRVVHHDSAYVRPLVAAHDEGRPAGIFDVSSDQARLLRWSFGEVEELWASGFAVEDDVVAREKQGPSAGNPANMARSHRDDFDDRIHENRHRFLAAAVDDVLSDLKEHAWDRLIVSGAAKLRDDATKLLEDAVPSGVRVMTADQGFSETNNQTIATQVWPLLRSVHLAREEALVRTVVERGLGGNGAALGLRNVCDALNEGRVRHLIYRSDLELEGYWSDEETVHPRVEGAIAQDDQVELHREPLFVERLIEKAVATGAGVTPIDPDVVGDLADHEDVGAVLRW